jgi:hypothetical protein
MARGTRVSRGTRTRFQRTANRKFVWARRLILGAAVGANTAVFSDLLSDFQTALGADALGVTVVRVRGGWNYQGGQILIAGIRIMTQSDFATMVSPGQGPAADQYADWMGYFPVFRNGAPADFQSQEIDIQSSRKLEELGQGLLLSVSNPTLDPSVFNMDLSIGLKLP